MNSSIHYEKGWRLGVGIILLNKEKIYKEGRHVYIEG